MSAEFLWSQKHKDRELSCLARANKFMTNNRSLQDDMQFQALFNQFESLLLTISSANDIFIQIRQASRDHVVAQLLENPVWSLDFLQCISNGHIDLCTLSAILSFLGQKLLEKSPLHDKVFFAFLNTNSMDTNSTDHHAELCTFYDVLAVLAIQERSFLNTALKIQQALIHSWFDTLRRVGSLIPASENLPPLLNQPAVLRLSWVHKF